MGVYLYGELMVQEDARQQALARRCLSFIKDDMDQSARSVVEEMILWIQTNQVRVSRPLCLLLYTVKKIFSRFVITTFFLLSNQLK